MKPLVSVIVATYRREESLVRALESLAVQTFQSFEIVLVDDNDDLQWNEKVRAITDTFVSTHKGIILKHLENNPNLGSAKARNAGIAVAEGQYITFLDDDDLYLPNKIQRQLSFMQEKDFDYSVTDLSLFNDKDQLIDRRTRSYIRETSKDALQRYHLMYHLTGTDTMMFKKSYLKQIGCFAPIDVGDEYYLIQRAIDGNGKFGYLPCCDIKAYVHTGDGGLSSGDGKIEGENALYTYKKQFFNRVSAKDVRYIKMRHYAVLAFTEIRRKKWDGFVKNAACSFFCAPIQCVRLLRNRGGL